MTAVMCFYIDLAARKGQSVASMVGSLAKWVVRGMESVQEENMCGLLGAEFGHFVHWSGDFQILGGCYQLSYPL